MQEKKKNERSMVKFPVIEFDLRKIDSKEDSKDPKKKIKPLMIDAWTQTERSDYAIIKSRLQTYKKLFIKLSCQIKKPTKSFTIV